jgi:anti-sigma B factor antagonist
MAVQKVTESIQPTLRFSLSREHRPARGTYLVRVEGELDVYTAPELDAELQELIASGAEHVTVDLEQVPFVDSCGLAVLVHAARRLGQGRLVLTGLGIEPRRALEISGLDRFLRLAVREGDAA